MWQLGQLSDFAGTGRFEAIWFVFGNFAYLSTGLNAQINGSNDLWQFDPMQDIWTQKASLPGIARNSALAMNIGGKGYLGTGYDGLNLLKDSWQYDPSSNSWTKRQILLELQGLMPSHLESKTSDTFLPDS